MVASSVTSHSRPRRSPAARVDLPDDRVPVLVAGSHDHLCAGGRAGQRDPAADAVAGAGHDDAAPVEGVGSRCHHRAAVDDHRRSGDAAAGGAGEVCDRRRDVVAQVGRPAHGGWRLERRRRHQLGRDERGGTSTALTVMPCGPHCRAADLPSARTPSTAVDAGTKPPAPVNPEVGATSTMRPVPVGANHEWAAWNVKMASLSSASPPRVPRGRVGVGELLRHQAGVVDAHVHDHVDRRGQGEGRAGGGPVGEAVRARGDRGAELSERPRRPRPELGRPRGSRRRHDRRARPHGSHGPRDVLRARGPRTDGGRRRRGRRRHRHRCERHARACGARPSSGSTSTATRWR